MKYLVTATYREDACKNDSPIIKLHLDSAYRGLLGHEIKDLKQLADEGNLQVKTHHYCSGVKVRIFFSNHHSRWIATTNADGSLCNNLHSLPIFYNTYQGGTKYYNNCSI